MPNDGKITARLARRSKCKISATVKFLNQEVSGQVIDLSSDGMALQLHGPIRIAAGILVTIRSGELGHLDGIIKWYDKGGKVGIQLQHTTSTLAQVSSYFRFFHRDARTVLQS